MKNIVYNFLLTNVLILFVSCSTSNEVSQNSRIQKRKYNNGFYIASFKKSNNKVKLDKETIGTNDLAELETINKSKNTLASNDLSFISQEENSTSNSFFEENETKVEFKSQNLKSNKIIKSPEFLEVNKSHNNVKWFKKNEIYNSDIKYNNHLKSQKSRKVNDEQLIFILLMVLAFVLPPLSVLLFTNIDWKKVLIATILTCLWWGPGILYAILVLLEVL